MEHHDSQDPAAHRFSAVPLRSRLAENLRSVVVTGLISASLLSVMYGVTLYRADEQAKQHQIELRHEAAVEAQRPAT